MNQNNHLIFPLYNVFSSLWYIAETEWVIIYLFIFNELTSLTANFLTSLGFFSPSFY